MDIVSSQTLTNVVSETLEQFAFVFAESELFPADPPAEDTPLLAEIGFKSSRRSGRLILAASQTLCSEVAQNVMGEDGEDEVSDEASRNALQEVVNITCGNLLAQLYGTEEMFELSVPECRDMSAEEWKELAGRENTISLNADEEPLLALLEVEEG